MEVAKGLAVAMAVAVAVAVAGIVSLCLNRLATPELEKLGKYVQDAGLGNLLDSGLVRVSAIAKAGRPTTW